MKPLLRLQFLALVLVSAVLAGDALVRQDNVSIHVPPGWALVNISEPPLLFQLLAPPRQGQVLQENINVTKLPLDKKMSAKEFLDENLPQLRSLFKEFHVTAESGSGSGVYWYTYEYAAAVGTMRAKQAIVVKGGFAYVATASALASSFEGWAFTFDRILGAVQIGE